MRLATILRLALRALARDRLRSGLAMLGIVVGVAATIAVVALGAGATGAVDAQIATMGENLLMVRSGSLRPGGVAAGAGAAPTLTPRDVAALARDCADASAIGLVVRTRAQVAHAGRNWAPGAVQGCDLGFLDVRGFLCAEGERFTDDDIAEAAQVCLLGRTVVENLFGDESPVGALVRVRGAPFRVVGVLEPKGANTWGADQDDVVLMPWTTVKKKLEGSAFEAVDYVFASARTTEAVAPLEDEIRAVLRERHRCATDEETGEPQDDFTIRDLTEAMRAMTATTRIMAALLAAVAAVSLLAGGAGIANIMVVSVAERTREIGLRMALGARARDVLAQFLLEAVALAGLGGAGGAVVGALGAVAASRIAAIPVVVSPGVVAAAVALSGAIGALAGIAPAWRASRLDPIAALRAE